MYLLKKIISYFDVEVTPTVYDEVEFSSRDGWLRQSVNKLPLTDIMEYVDIVEPLRMTLSKGEFEVIVAALFFKHGDKDFLFVLARALR